VFTGWRDPCDGDEGVLIMRCASRRQQGVTLIELLVGLAVAGIVLIGVISAWAASVRVALYTEEAARLHNDLRGIMQIVTQDLRRADRGTVQIAPDGRCLTFNVSPPATKTSFGGICNADATADSECWEPRGYRWNNSQFQLYLVRGPAPAASCATNANWISLYDGLAPGSFTVSEFRGLCQMRCIDLSETAADELIDVSFPVADRLAACSAAPRCSFSEYVEVLSLELQLTGTVTVNAQPRQLTLREFVTVRNNNVLQ